MNILKVIILTLILLAPIAVTTSLVIFDDNREYEVLQTLNQEEEEDERGSDELAEESSYITQEMIYTELSDQMEFYSDHRITYRNKYFVSLIAEVLTPPPEL